MTAVQPLPKKVIAGVVALGVAVRACFFYYLYVIYRTPGSIHFDPTYGEANTYEIPARTMLQAWDFSHPLLDYRPPIQGLFISLFYTIFGEQPLLPLAAQQLTSAAIAIPAILIARELGFSKRVQLAVGLIVALDIASIVIGLTLMAETLGNFLLTIFLLYYIRLLKNSRWQDAVLAAIALGLSTLTRPTPIYYLVFALVPMVFFVKRWPQKMAVLTGVFLIIVLPWFYRNQVHAGEFTISTVGNFDLLFYKGVSVYSKANNISPEEADAELAYQLDLRLGQAGDRADYSVDDKWKFLTAGDSRTEEALTSYAFEIFRAYPLTYIAVTPGHLAKMILKTNLLEIISLRWLYAIEYPFHAVGYLLVLAGTILALVRRHWLLLSVTVLPIAYFIGVPLILGGTGMDTRARTPVTTSFVLLAVYAFTIAYDRYSTRATQ